MLNSDDESGEEDKIKVNIVLERDFYDYKGSYDLYDQTDLKRFRKIYRFYQNFHIYL